MHNRNATAYIPTQHRGKLSAANHHEYFGKDFQEGKNEFALFKSPKGRHYCVWTYGTWDYMKLEEGQTVTFQHTQTFRQVEMEYVKAYPLADFKAFIEDASAPDLPVIHWTLK